MTPKTLIWLVLATSVGAASCALIRDFDELQSAEDETGGDGSTGDGGTAGTTAAAGAAGAPGSAGTSSGGGSDGSGGSGCDCDDDDPCTRDTCNAQGECIHRTNGAVPDGVSVTLDDGNVQAISLTANGGHFYAAITIGDDTTSEVRLYSVANDETSLRDGPALSDSAVLGNDTLRAVPGAAVALLARTEAPLTVAAFAPLTDTPEGTAVSAAQVWAVNLNEQLEPLDPISAYGLPSGVNGAYAVGQRAPIAWEDFDSTHVAWIDVGGTMRLHTVGGITRMVGEAGLTPTVIAPFGSTSEPGLLWFGANPEQGYVEFPATVRAPFEIDGCASQGLFITADSAPLTDGVWSVVWTRAEFGSNDEVLSLGSEGHTVACGGPASCGFTPDCTNQPHSGGYGTVVATTTRQAESGVIYEATLAPSYLGDGTATALLQIHWAELVEGGRYLQLISGPGRQITDAPLASAQVEFSAGSYLGVAWVEENGGTGQGEARIERFRLCPPTATDIAAAVGG